MNRKRVIVHEIITVIYGKIMQQDCHNDTVFGTEQAQIILPRQDIRGNRNCNLVKGGRLNKYSFLQFIEMQT